MVNANYEILKFVDEELQIDVKVDANNDTVWLTTNQMADLFQRDRTVILRHINNIFSENELSSISNVQILHIAKSDKPVKFYNLDVIISVGYRVKSKRGILFRKWANNVLKDYLLKGYAVNKKRIEVLNKTIDIQNKMLSFSLNIDSEKLADVINQYTNALDLLDNYDHMLLQKPNGSSTIYKLEYDECRKIIDNMKFNEKSNLFGKEKEVGKLNGILETIYQTAFGSEVYPSVEDKASHLLYFLVKDHPFFDGCKRIASTLFLEFLNKNNALLKNNKLIIDNNTLVATVILVAESKPDEMEIITTLIMNLLCN